MRSTRGWLRTLGRLPPELILMVLQELADDKQTLSACVSVTHFWRELSLPFLFVKIKAKSSTSFLDTLCFFSHHLDCARCVKSLTLSRTIDLVPPPPKSKGGRSALPIFHDGPPALDLLALATVLPLLSSLRKLVLEDVYPYLETRNSTDDLVPPATTVSRLDLDLYGNSTFAHLPEILRVTRPKTVTLGEFDEDASPTPWIANVNPVWIPRLIVERSAAGTLGLLSKDIHRDALRSLRVTLGNRAHFGGLCALLLQVQHSLTTLDVDLCALVHEATQPEPEFYAWFWDTPEPTPIRWEILGQALSRCKTLTSLRLVVPAKRHSDLPLPPGTNRTHLPIFSGIFKKSSDALHGCSVTVCFTCEDPDYASSGSFRDGEDGPEVWDLHVLDARVEEKVDVTVELVVPESRTADDAVLRRVVKERLPRLRDASYLKFVPNKDESG